MTGIGGPSPVRVTQYWFARKVAYACNRFENMCGRRKELAALLLFMDSVRKTNVCANQT